jgi:hypothetical protein
MVRPQQPALSWNHVIDPAQPIRSAITVADISEMHGGA